MKDEAIITIGAMDKKKRDKEIATLSALLEKFTCKLNRLKRFQPPITPPPSPAQC